MAFGVEAKGSILDAAESRFFFASRADALEVSDDLIDRLIGVSRLDPSERLEAALDLDAFVNRLPRRHKLTRVTIPAVGEFVKNQAIARLRIVSTRLMVALEACRASTGSFPDALEDLVPGIVGHLPADPVAGGPFMYRLVEDDPHGRPYLLYVTGLDLVDDGGNELPGAGVQINWTLPLRETWCGGFDVVVNTPRPLPDE
jgi:hypothetical protein